MSKRYDHRRGVKKSRTKITYRSYPEGREQTTDLEYSNDEFIHEPVPEDRPPPAQPTPRHRNPAQGSSASRNPNYPCTERISNCVLTQVQKMRSDPDLSKSKQALELERLQSLELDEMDEREQEIYHLYTQTASIDHTCSRISQELNSILGKHEYIRQLREHSKNQERALQKNPQALEMLRRAQKNSVTVGSVHVEEPLLDVLKRSLEKKLDKLRFLQCLADGVNATTSREDTPSTAGMIPRDSCGRLASPRTGTSQPSTVTIDLPGPSKRNAPLKSSRTEAQRPAQPEEDSNSYESASENEADRRFGKLEPVMSDYEEEPEELFVDEPVLSEYEDETEEPFTDEQVYEDDFEDEDDEEDEDDDEGEVFPSSREEDRWADSEGSDRSEPRRQVRTRTMRGDTNSTISNASKPVSVVQQASESSQRNPQVIAAPKAEEVPQQSQQAIAAAKNVDQKDILKRIRHMVPKYKDSGPALVPETEDPIQKAVKNLQDQNILRKLPAQAPKSDEFSEEAETTTRKEDPTRHKLLDEYQPPRTDLVRVKPGMVQPLKAHVFPWMKTSASKTKTKAKKKAAATSSTASPSSSDTAVAGHVPSLPSGPPKIELLKRGAQFPGPRTVQPSLVVTGKALPPLPPAPEVTKLVVTKPKKSEVKAAKKPEAKLAEQPSKPIAEIPAQNLLVNVNTVLDPAPPSKSKLLEKKSRPATPTVTNRANTPKRPATPKRPSLNVAKNRQNSSRNVKLFNTIFTNPGGISDMDSEEEEGMNPTIRYSRHVKLTSQDRSLDRPPVHSTHVKSILRNSLKATTAINTIPQVKAQAKEKPKPNRFVPIHTFPPDTKPRPKTPPGKPKPVAPEPQPKTIARVADSRLAIRKRRASTPIQFKTEYSSNFMALSLKRSDYRSSLNPFRKPPVPSHYVSNSTLIKKFDSPTASLTKKISASANYYLRAPKRPSVSNLDRVLKTKSRTNNVDARARAKAGSNRFRVEEKKPIITRKNLPDHLVFGNFTGIKIARSARGVKSGAIVDVVPPPPPPTTKAGDVSKSHKVSRDRDKLLTKAYTKVSHFSHSKNK